MDRDDIFINAREDFKKRLQNEKENFVPRKTLVVDTALDESPNLNIQVVGFMDRGNAALVKVIEKNPRYENSILVSELLESLSESFERDQRPLNVHIVRTTLMIMKGIVQDMLEWYPSSLSTALGEFLDSSLDVEQSIQLCKKKLNKTLVKLQNNASKPYVKQLIGDVNESVHLWKQQKDKSKLEKSVLEIKFLLLRLVQKQGEVRRNKVVYDLLYKKSSDLLEKLGSEALSKQISEEQNQHDTKENADVPLQWENSIKIPPLMFEKCEVVEEESSSQEEENDKNLIIPCKHFVFAFDWENQGLNTVFVPPFPSIRKQVTLCNQYASFIYQYDGSTLRILRVESKRGELVVHKIFLNVTPCIKDGDNIENYTDFQCWEDQRFSFIHSQSGDLIIFFLSTENNSFECKRLSINREVLKTHTENKQLMMKLERPFKLHKWSGPSSFSVVSTQEVIYKFVERSGGNNTIFRLDGVFGMQHDYEKIKLLQVDDKAGRLCASSALRILINTRQGSSEELPLNHTSNIHFVSQLQLVGSYCVSLCYNGMMVIWENGEEVATLSIPVDKELWFLGDVDGARNAFYFDKSHRVVSYSCVKKQFTCCCL